MKKIIQYVRHFSFGILLSGLLLLPKLSTSQTGENDLTFNTFDNKPAYGTNGTVVQSVIQPDNKTIISGGFSHYNNQLVEGLARLNSDGQLDPSFSCGTGVDRGISDLILQFDNKILIGGSFTTYNGISANHIARLLPNGELDHSFKSGGGADNTVLSIALQPNGKLLVGGELTAYDGNTVNKLVRLNKNGTIDNTFHFSDSVENVENIVVQTDGKIIVSGNAHHRQYLIRLNKNGSRDNTFSYPDLFPWGHPSFEALALQGNKLLVGGGIYSGIETRNGLLMRLDPSGAVDTTFEFHNQENVWIKSITLQEDNKIIFTGRSWIYADDDVSTNYIGRLNSTGEYDPTFKVHHEERRTAISSYTASIQADGKIIVGGRFSTISNLLVDNIVRLNSNGDFDPTFNQKTGANGSIFSSVKQSDGSILIGGKFSSYNYKTINGIARLKKNGSLDPSFNTGTGVNGAVHAIALQSNGKIIIGGEFTSYNNEPCNHIARLNKNGTLDKSFNDADVNGVVYTLAIQQNDKIIVGGKFTQVNGRSLVNVARLNANGKIDQVFSSPFLNNDQPVVYVCKIQKNGKLLVGGNFSGLYPSGSRYYNLVRLHSKGNLDADFTGDVPESVYAIEFHTDNKILIGGGRVQVGYHQIDPFKGYLFRLNPDGTDDSLFECPFKKPSEDLWNPVRTISVLKNGKIFFGGNFSSAYNSSILNHIGLLNENGSVDSSFTNNANSNVFTSTLVGRNKLIIAGDFTLYNNDVRTGIARIDVANEYFYGSPLAAALPAAAESPSLAVFPNPASIDITVSNLPSGSKLTIRNALGAQMDTRFVNNGKTTIELNDYANGIYFITAESGGTVTNLKFIVTK